MELSEDGKDDREVVGVVAVDDGAEVVLVDVEALVVDSELVDEGEPVITVPEIGMGVVIKLEVESADDVNEDDPPDTGNDWELLIVNCGLAFPESPMTTTM